MSDYQGFAWFFFCFQWSAWFVNLAVYSPKNQCFWNYKLCISHALVFKNSPLLSGVCLLISWVQKYTFFSNYASLWLLIFQLKCKVQAIYIDIYLHLALNSVFSFLYSFGDTPFNSLKTLLKCGTSLNPTAKQISDICFCECFRSSQAVFKRYWITNCENVIPLHRLK